MRTVFIALVGGIMVGGLAVWGFTHQEETPAVTTDDVPAIGRPSDEGSVRLRPEQQVKAGIAVASLATIELPQEVKAYGQVINPQPLLDFLTELKSTEASLDASAKEYARVRALYANDQNASARAVEAAEAAMKRDQIQLEAVQHKLTSAWGPGIVRGMDNLKMVQALTTLDAVMMRVDVPLGESLSAPPASARVLSPTDPRQWAEARFLGLAQTAPMQAPGQGFLFLLQPNSLDLRPDMSVVAFLKMRGAQLHGQVLPRSAIIRHEAQTWIYTQTDEETFIRRAVVLDRATDEGWFVTNTDLTGRVVVAGAQTLLSEELKSQIRLAD